MASETRSGWKCWPFTELPRGWWESTPKALSSYGHLIVYSNEHIYSKSSMNERLNLSIFAINLNAILTGLIWIESLDIVGRTLLPSIPCYYIFRIKQLFSICGSFSLFWLRAPPSMFSVANRLIITGVARDQELRSWFMNLCQVSSEAWSAGNAR